MKIYATEQNIYHTKKGKTKSNKSPTIKQNFEDPTIISARKKTTVPISANASLWSRVHANGPNSKIRQLKRETILSYFLQQDKRNIRRIRQEGGIDLLESQVELVEQILQVLTLKRSHLGEFEDRHRIKRRAWRESKRPSSTPWSKLQVNARQLEFSSPTTNPIENKDERERMG